MRTANYLDQAILGPYGNGLHLSGRSQDTLKTIFEDERYRPLKIGVAQCGNCLSFGHGTRFCYMKPRCSICAVVHVTADCNQMGEGVEPKCVKCGANQVGSNRSCPKRSKYVEVCKPSSSKINKKFQFQRRPSPPVMEEHFPYFRYNVPNLPPLVNHRPAIPPTDHHSSTMTYSLCHQFRMSLLQSGEIH